MPDLATLLARLFVMAALGWCLYVGLCIAVQAIGPASLEPEDDEEFAGVDDTAEWDLARDRQLDADLWPVIA